MKDHAQDLLDQLAARGVLGVAFGANRVRLVTHYGITRDDVDDALSIVACCPGRVDMVGA